MFAQKDLYANPGVDLEMTRASNRYGLRGAYRGANTTSLGDGKARPCRAQAPQQLQHDALSINRSVNTVYIVERLSILERTVITSGRLDTGLEPGAEMPVEHHISAETQKEAAQAARGLTERVGRSGCAGSESIRRGSAIEPGPAGGIVKASEA